MRKNGIRRNGRRGGFTLLEILVVIAIIALLAAFVVPNLVGVQDKSSIKLTQSKVASGGPIAMAIDTFRLDVGRYPKELAERFRELNILPALKDAWTHEAINEPRPYWSGQRIGTLYAQLAEDVPPQYTSPCIEFAKIRMADVVSACAGWYDRNAPRPDDSPDVAARKRAEFERFVQARLKEGADEVRHLMRRNPF